MFFGGWAGGGEALQSKGCQRTATPIAALMRHGPHGWSPVPKTRRVVFRYSACLGQAEVEPVSV